MAKTDKDYLARTFIVLSNVRRKPGDIVSAADLADSGQTQEDIDRLLADGAISEDLSADPHPDHAGSPAGSADEGVGDEE